LTVWSPGKGQNPTFGEAKKALERDGRVANKGMEFGPTCMLLYKVIEMRMLIYRG
jgi:hypothetical protein